MISRHIRRLNKRLSELTRDKFKFESEVNKDTINIYGEDYFKFQDEGVKGIESGKSEGGHKFKKPYNIPASSFSKYTSDKSAQFAMARSVEKKGIKPKNYTDKFAKDPEIDNIVEDIYADMILNDKL